MRLGEIFQMQTERGTSTTVGNLTVTPESQVVMFRLPFGGFVWNRPVAVVLDVEGERRRIPIVDVTRVAQLVSAGLMVGLIVWSRSQKRKELRK